MRMIITSILMLLSISSYAQQAKWITADSQQANDVNTWIEFRKEFIVDKLDKKVTSI